MENSNLRKAVLAVLVLTTLVISLYPKAFVSALTVSLIILAALGVADLLTREQEKS